MKLLDARPDWKEEFDNDPEFIILVDKMPRHNEYIYQKKVDAGCTAYFCNLNGLVDFFLHNPLDERGYGGRIFTAPLEDGTTDHVKGPWSSCYTYMAHLFNTPCMDCAIIDNREEFERGYTLYSSNMTIELALQAAKICNVYLLEITDKETEEKYYIPSINPYPNKPRKIRTQYGFKSAQWSNRFINNHNRYSVEILYAPLNNPNELTEGEDNDRQAYLQLHKRCEDL